VLCCKHVCDPDLRKTRWRRKKIKLKELKRRTTETKEPFWQREDRLSSANPVYEKNLSVCKEIALELIVQGGLGKAYRKSQTCLQHALSYVDKRENV